MMPRPRILASRRSNLRSGTKSEIVQTTATVVTIDDKTKSDCEYIKINDDNKEIVTLNDLKFPEQSTNVEATPKIKQQIANVQEKPKIIMAVPIKTQQGEIVKTPSLCMLKKVVDPKEISKIKRAIVKKEKRQLCETPEKLSLEISVNDSIQNIEKTSGNQAFSVSPESVANVKKIDHSAEQKKYSKVVRHSNIPASTSRQTNLGIVGSKTNSTIDCSKNPVETPKTSYPRREKVDYNACNNNKTVVDPKELAKSIDNVDKISTSGTSLDNAKLLKTVKISLGMPKIPAHGVNSINNQKSTISLIKKRGQPKNTPKTQKTAVPTTPVISKFVENEDSPETAEVTVLKIEKSSEGIFRNVECIVCKKNFIDRTELHRHATLAHPNVQMLFCGNCSDSFLTHIGLEAHRANRCKAAIAKIYENEKLLKNTVAKNKLKPSQTLAQSKRLRWKKAGRKIDITRKTVKIRELKRTLAVLMGKSKNVQPIRPAYANHAPKRGRPRKHHCNFVTKYAEKEVMNHEALATRTKLDNAAIMKLVVPMDRLEGPTLEKYMQKHAEQPVTVFRAENDNKSLNRRRSVIKIKSEIENNPEIENEPEIENKSENEEKPENQNKLVNNKKTIQRSRWRSNNRDKIVNAKRITRLRRKFVESEQLSNNRKSTLLKIKKDAIIKRERASSISNGLKSNANDETTSACIEKPTSDDASDVNAAPLSQKRGKKLKTPVITENERPIESIANETTTDSIDAVIDSVARSGTEQPIVDSLTATIDYVARFGAEQSSDEEYQPIHVTPKDSLTNERSVIRKLTSRSSASSFALLRNNENNSELLRGLQLMPIQTPSTSAMKSVATVNWYIGKEKSAIKNNDAGYGEITIEPPEMESSNDMTLEEFDPEQFGNVSIDNKKDNVNTTEKNPQSVVNQQRKIDDSSNTNLINSNSRKTYLPSKKKVTNATTSILQASKGSFEFCSMCKELFALMKQLAGQFDGNKAKRMSVKCPLCTLHFISMFYLEEHLAKYHLHCLGKVPCKKSKTPYVEETLKNDNVPIDCETEVDLFVSCHRCSMEFDDEKDLKDHVFGQHDAPPFLGDSSTSAPHYLNNLRGSCCETMDKSSIPFPIGRRSSASEAKTVDNAVAYTSEPKKVDNAVANAPMVNVEYVTIIPLICTFCGGNFLNRADYVRHIKAIHDFSSSSSMSIDPSRSDAKELNYSSTIDLESNSVSILAASKPKGIEQITADRAYLLKQLLSDDSMDGIENMETTESGDDANAIEPTKSDDIITIDEKFDHGNYTKPDTSIKDRSNTNLEYDSNVSKMSIDAAEVLQKEMIGLFADSPVENFDDVVLIDSTEVEVTTEELIPNPFTSESMNEDATNVDDIFVNADDDLSKKSAETVDLESLTNSERTEKLAQWIPAKPFKLKTNVGTPKSNNEKSEISKISEKIDKPIANTIGIKTNRQLPIECGKCNRKFPNQTSLNEHLFYLHDDNLKETVLTDVLPPISRLDETISTEPKQWRCEQCSHNFKSFENYGRHRYFVHNDDEMVHVCENCCKVLTSVTMVNVHICSDVPSYNCRICNETFATGMALRLHNTDKHFEEKGPHLCKTCDKKFLTNGMLKRHEKWKHRFLRTYKSRRSSPVPSSTLENPSCKFNDDYADNEMDSGCDQEYVDLENELAGRRSTEDSNEDSTSAEESTAENVSIASIDDVEDHTETEESTFPRYLPFDPTGATTYIDENEIYQCNLCQLYCLSKSALRTHKIQCHSCMAEICKVCKIMYSKGKLIRHMIDHHVNPCDSYVETTESIWDLGKSVEEKDAEELIKILGMRRLISLCEYQRYRVPNDDRAITCPTCGLEFGNGDLYKHHFLMHHDFICALCNIEFKSGDKAALHKIEDHGSAAIYIWFVDKTVTALTAATNFTEAAEQSFMDMISRESDESSTVSRDDNDDLLDETEDDREFTERIEKKRKNLAESQRNDDETVGEDDDTTKIDDAKLIIVVTDEDLNNYGIGTHNPNIWGLASKISSTSNELTPTDVKGMLESYFGR